MYKFVHCKIYLCFILLISYAFSYGTEKVYLIHGYGSSTAFMGTIDKALHQSGYRTEKFEYRSIKSDLKAIGLQLYNEVIHSNADTISFVSHSMGALVIRSMYQYIDSVSFFPVIHRIVMIAPPNKGAEMADFFSSNKVLAKLMGPNILYMRTDTNSLANLLPKPVAAEIGIIIGIRGKEKGYNPFIHQNNDGLLSMQKAFLGNEKEVVLVRASHSFLKHKRQAVLLTDLFIKTGSFLSSPIKT